MTEVFRIGLSADPVYDLLPLDDVLQSAGVSMDPDWSYQSFSTKVKLSNGINQGNGFAIVKWRWNGLALKYREILRTFCLYPALSAENIYIHTPITETQSDVYESNVLVWKTFKVIMNWPDEAEDFQVDKDLGFILTFTHCEEQP